MATSPAHPTNSWSRFRLSMIRALMGQ